MYTNMDENVVFDPGENTDQQQQNPSQEPDSGVNSTTEKPNLPNSGQDNAVVEAPETNSSDQTQVDDTSSSVEKPELEESEIPPSAPPPIKSRGGALKKIIIGVVVFVILLFVIILIIPKGSGNTKANLVWWGLWEDQSVMQPLIDDFHKQNPNITVEYVKQDPKLYREKLETRIKNGTGPDIFRFHNTWVPMLSGDLLPLSSDVITPTEFKKSFYPVMQKDLVQNGAIYGIPLEADTLGLFVNTEILDQAGIQPPQTWEDFVKAAKTLTVKDGGKIKTAGAALGTYGNITHAPDIISLLFVQQGVDLNKFSKYVQDESDAIDFYTSFAKGDNSVWDSTLDESILSFGRGTLAMYIGYSWDIFKIQAINSNLPFKTFPVPQLVGKKATIASYWVEGVSSKSKNQRAALLFMQYLAKKETAQKFYTTVSKTRSFGEPYARTDLQKSLKDNKTLFPFVSQLDSADSSYFASDTNDGTGGINSLSNNYLGDAINSIVNDNSSEETVIDTLDKGVAQVLQKYGIQ
jgi:multiple sugar transport system substrate-binding protein